MLKCGFMDRQEKVHGSVRGNRECVNTPFSWCTSLLRLSQLVAAARKTAAFLANCLPLLGSVVTQQQHYTFKSVSVLVEAYLKPVAFLATSLCFLIGLSSHPAAALYI